MQEKFDGLTAMQRLEMKSGVSATSTSRRSSAQSQVSSTPSNAVQGLVNTEDQVASDEVSFVFRVSFVFLTAICLQ